MNWQSVARAMVSISKGAPDLAPHLATLRAELSVSSDETALNTADRAEIMRVLEALATANLYGRIALVGQLKEVLSKAPAFQAHFAEYGPRDARA